MPPPPAPQSVPAPAPQPTNPRPVLNPVPRQGTGPESHLSRRIKLTVHPDGVVLTDTTKAENPDHAVRLSRGGWTTLKQVMGDFNAARITPYQWDVDEFSTAPKEIQRDVELCDGIHASQTVHNKSIYVHFKYWMTYTANGRHYPSRLGITLNEAAWTLLTDPTTLASVDGYLAATPSHTGDEPSTPTPMRPLEHPIRERLQNLWMRCWEITLTPVLTSLQKKYCGACNQLPEAKEHTCISLDLMTVPGFVPFLPEALERVDNRRVLHLFRQRVRDGDVTSPANVDVFLNRFAIKQDAVDFEKVFTAYLENEEMALADLVLPQMDVTPSTLRTPIDSLFPSTPIIPITVTDEDFEEFSQVF